MKVTMCASAACALRDRGRRPKRGEPKFAGLSVPMAMAVHWDRQTHGGGFEPSLASQQVRGANEAGACESQTRQQPASRVHRRNPRLAAHAFSSRLSSFKKRQSVLPAMIFCGLDLIMPASCSLRA